MGPKWVTGLTEVLVGIEVIPRGMPEHLTCLKDPQSFLNGSLRVGIKGFERSLRRFQWFQCNLIH